MLKTFRSYQLAKEVYREGLALNLTGELRDQLQRALLSICLNLAEGSGRSSKADYLGASIWKLVQYLNPGP